MVRLRLRGRIGQVADAGMISAGCGRYDRFALRGSLGFRRIASVSTAMFASPFTRTIAASSDASPSSTEVKPTVLAIPKNSCSRGRRRSQHTRPTRWPARPSATARFDSVAVLPSPALGLVIWSV